MEGGKGWGERKEGSKQASLLFIIQMTENTTDSGLAGVCRRYTVSKARVGTI
jgi:hypothetical protein